MAIPSGQDRCYTVGRFGEPQPFQLANHGSVVALTARDQAHQRDLWIGDLAEGTVRLAYRAPEPVGTKAEIWYPQMVDGALVWLERLHAGDSIVEPVKEWSIKRMDLATDEVVELERGAGISFGGAYYVDPMRFDGRRLALGRLSAGSRWQIEIIDLADRSRTVVPLDESLYDLALVDGGLLYTTGTNNKDHDSVGNMSRWSWSKSAGSTKVGEKDFELAADGKLAAWVNDPLSSDQFAGEPAEARVVVGLPPYTAGTFLSLEAKGKPTIGISKLVAGSESLAWWETEWAEPDPLAVLTLWQSGWKSPVQIETAGDSPMVSVNGGWLVWIEVAVNSEVRMRGVPLSALTPLAEKS